MRNSTVWGNAAEIDGGGLYLHGGEADLRGVAVLFNKAGIPAFGFGRGGGIATNDQGTAHLEKSWPLWNEAVDGKECAGNVTTSEWVAIGNPGASTPGRRVSRTPHKTRAARLPLAGGAVALGRACGVETEAACWAPCQRATGRPCPTERGPARGGSWMFRTVVTSPPSAGAVSPCYRARGRSPPPSDWDSGGQSCRPPHRQSREHSKRYATRPGPDPPNFQWPSHYPSQCCTARSFPAPRLRYDCRRTDSRQWCYRAPGYSTRHW